MASHLQHYVHSLYSLIANHNGESGQIKFHQNPRTLQYRLIRTWHEAICINRYKRGIIMVTAARTASQVMLHMSVAFGVMWAVTGSLAFGGLAAIVEPVCNVALLPLHEKLWIRIQAMLDSRAEKAALSNAKPTA
jgi:uncharacterized membrane protein